MCKCQTIHFLIRCHSAHQISNSFQLSWLQHTFLSWAVPHPVTNSPWHISYDSSIFPNLGSSLLQFYTLASLGLHAGTPLTHEWLTLLAFLSHEGRFYNTFLVSLTPKPELQGQSCQVLLLARTVTQPLIQSHLYQLSVFSVFLHCLSFSLIPFPYLEA